MKAYINLLTLFGFKKIFGDEANKVILIDFFNALLGEEEGNITKVTFQKNELFDESKSPQEMVVDIHCETETGKEFVIELQKPDSSQFKKRSLFYSTFPITKQAKECKWNAVYTIGILDFIFDDDPNNAEDFFHKLQFADTQTGRVLSNSLTYIYIEMPKFKKSLEACETRLEQWLYILKNLEQLDTQPIELQDEVFEKLFNIAAYSNLTIEEITEYEASLKRG